ncbi:MAG: trehalose-phosphatase [Salinarimonadaceae bacterium]|nr:MAG: trehalose-phosphatase [Salinarimonadaceae bacterium]
MTSLTAIHVDPAIDLEACAGGRAFSASAADRGLALLRDTPDEPRSAAALVAGLDAARAALRGGYAQVVAVAREGRDALLAAGLDIVAADPAEIYVDADGLVALKTLRALPSALDRIAEIEGRLGAARRAVFLDYDGTLAEIVENPADARLADPMRAAVSALAQTCPVAIVSGRDLEDVRALVDLEGLHYAGSHGFVMAGPGGWRETAPEGAPFPPILDAAEAALRDALAGADGVVVERKSFSLAVHHRRAAPGAEALVEAALARVLAAQPRLSFSAGKKVFDVKPRVDWDKGRATLALLRRFAEGATPLYIGDDTTDEDAFRALAGPGVTIVVRDGGDRATAADYALDGVSAVEEFLRRLGTMSRAPRVSGTPGDAP